MSCDDESTIDQLFTVRRGDAWVFDVNQTSDDNLSGWDAETLLVQVREAANEGATLAASSDPEDESEAVALIDPAGTTFGDGDSRIKLVMEDSVKLAAGTYYIEAEVEIDGLVRTIIPGPTQSAQPFRVLEQVAMAGGGS